MAVRPLRPATRLRLGEPLPHLLADRTRVPQLPDYSFYLSAYGVLADVSTCCPPALDSSSRVTHPSATKVYQKQASFILPFDLHVLSTPPAFVLSQDQTLRLILVSFTYFLTYCILLARFNVTACRNKVYLQRRQVVIYYALREKASPFFIIF